MSFPLYDGVHVFGVCAVGGEDQNGPLTYYAPTKEWLCEYHLDIRIKQGQVKEKIKQTDREKATWDELVNS